MKSTLSFFVLWLSFTIQAQVKIGDNHENLNTNALLELESTNKGVLFPRLALVSLDNASPLSAHVQGMMIYNTATAGSGVNAVTPGLYYNTGITWQKIVPTNDVIPTQSGNSGKSLSTNGTSLQWDKDYELNLTPTTETETGETFLGHKVYRKRISGTYNGDDFQYFSIPNVKAVYKVYGIAQRNGYAWNETSGSDRRVYAFGFGTYSVAFCGEYWTDRVNDRLVIFNMHSWFRWQPYHMIVEYIKEELPGNFETY